MRWISAGGLVASLAYSLTYSMAYPLVYAGVAGSFLFPTAASAQSGRSATERSVTERFVNVRDPNQVPTARYGRGENVDLSLILEEWRDRFPATPLFVCTCRNQVCGDETVWPFREFSLYQPFVALGARNAANNESSGFKCFDIETGQMPRDR